MIDKDRPVPLLGRADKGKYREVTWADFRNSGMLQWVNQQLHLFGVAIVVEMNDDGKNVARAYPARCSCRGFSWDAQIEMYERMSQYMNLHSEDLLEDTGADS